MKKYIFMAVAGMLALSSCSSDDNEQTPQNAPRQMTFTAGFGDGTQTRTTLNTADKSVSFDANDAISIFSENNTNVQFTTTLGGATAEFTGTAVAGDATYYAVYPYNDSYTFSNGIVSGVTIENSQLVNIFDGETWSKSSVISYATATGSDLEFHNACALLKITNNTGVVAEIEISADQYLAGTSELDTSTGALTVTDGTNSVTTRIIPDNETVYLAIAPGTYTNFTAAKSNAGDGGEWYSKTKASVTFEAGKIYDLGTTSSWMTQPASEDKGKLICTEGHIHAYGEDAECTADRVAMIVYVGPTGHDTYTHGLALAMEDMCDFGLTWDNSGGTNYDKTAAEWCSEWNMSKPVKDAEWLLASKDQWDYMLGDAPGSYEALRDGFESVGGSNLQSGDYWSSTEVGSDAQSYFFGSGIWNVAGKSSNFRVRACLAF